MRGYARGEPDPSVEDSAIVTTLRTLPAPDPSAVPLRRAADQLGITRHAVRQRIRRGTLTSYTRDGRWYVILPADLSGADTRTPPRTSPAEGYADPSVDQSANTQPDPSADTSGDLRTLVDHLQGEVAFLRQLTEHQAGQLAELRRGGSLPAVAAPPLGLDRLVAALKENAPTPRRRPWWRRLFREQ